MARRRRISRSIPEEEPIHTTRPPQRGASSSRTARAGKTCPGGPPIRRGVEPPGGLRASLTGGASPRRLPQLPRRAQILEEISARRLTVGVEILAVHPGTGEALDTPEGLRRLYNLMNAVSGMKDLEYYW